MKGEHDLSLTTFIVDRITATAIAVAAIMADRHPSAVSEFVRAVRDVSPAPKE